MSDLEKMLRNALDKGETSGELAQRLGSILKKVEEEKEAEDAAKLAAEEAKASIKKEKGDFIGRCVEEFDAHWCEDHSKLNARDAAMVALVVAMQNKANDDWSLDEVKEFIDSMTKVIQFNLDMHEGSLDPKAKGERTLKMFSKQIADTFDEIGMKDILHDFPFLGMNAFKKTFGEGFGKARRSGDALQEWLEKQGW